MEAIGLAAEFDEMAVMHEPIEERGDGRSIAEHLRPVFQRSVRGNHRRGTLVATHNDLQEIFGGVHRQFTHSDIIDDEELYLRRGRDYVGAFSDRVGKQQLREESVRFAIEEVESGVNRRHPDGLCDMALAHPGVSEHEYVIALLDEAGGSEFEDERTVETGVEAPVERVERLRLA